VKEILRLQHIHFVDEQGVRLEDLNLTVFAGEIVCLLGVHGSGKSDIKRLLAGSHGIVSGTIYFDEKPSASPKRDDFAKAGIQIINGSGSLVGSMSIAENLFLLRRRKGFRLWFDVRAARMETMQILAEYGIVCRPDVRIDGLSYYKQYLLCIAKAASYGVKLLVLDLAGTSFSYQQICALSKQIERLRKERDLSFLVLCDEPEPLLEYANRVIILQDGCDVCTMYRDDFSITRMARYLSATSLLPKGQNGVRDASKAQGECTLAWTICVNGNALLHVGTGEITGLFDTMRDTSDDLEGYLRLLVQNSNFDVTYATAFSRADADFVCIPENSADRLVTTLSIGDNLLLPAHRRMTQFGALVSPAVMRYAVRDYFDRVHISDQLQNVQQLTRLERKILSIHRWLLTHPRMLVLENPDAGLDLRDRVELYRYLSTVSDEGTAVLVITHNTLVLQEHCDFMIIADNGRVLSAYEHNFFQAEKLLYKGMQP